MKSLLSVLVAALFAAVSLNAVAQKDVTTKDANAAKAKDGTAVQTKAMKDKPKAAPMPKMKAKAKKEKPETGGVKAKTGGDVTSKDKKDVKATK